MTKLPISKEQLAKYFDHTLLKPDARPDDIRRLCDEAIEWGFRTVCVNPTMIKLVSQCLGKHAPKACSVVGFPLGATVSDIKVSEALRAVGDGAWEIDMVISIGHYLAGDHESRKLCRDDIKTVIRVAQDVPVKVILETGFLSPDQITEISGWCVEEGAAFVKTSTGFGPRGADVLDIAAMRRATAGTTTKIKASGSIRDLRAVTNMINAGADRIGSSQSVKIMSEFCHSLDQADPI